MLALNWLGDSLDGTLARVRRQQRPRYGFYVDHMVDIFGSVALMCGLGCSGFLHWQTAIAMLVAFLLLSSESYLATYTLSRFQLSQGIFGPTEIRILLIIGNLALLRSPYSTLFGHRMLLFDLGGTIAAVSMFAMAIDRHHPPHGAALPGGAAAVNTLHPLVASSTWWERWAWWCSLPRWLSSTAGRRATTFVRRLRRSSLRCVHNFVWHLHYTWRDRRDDSALLAQLCGFISPMGWFPCWGTLR